ncbi:unnamed protein product [Closterium sp. NIES-65]|nr:unnamed protein product [Closterium sp. NIES-65]
MASVKSSPIRLPILLLLLLLLAGKRHATSEQGFEPYNSISSIYLEHVPHRALSNMVCGDVLCGDVLCGVVLCGVVLCSVVLCGDVLCGDVLCCDVLCGVVLYGVVVCGVVLCGDVLCGVMCCVVSCCAVLCCAVLCCAVRCCDDAKTVVVGWRFKRWDASVKTWCPPRLSYGDTAVFQWNDWRRKHNVVAIGSVG